MTVTLDWNEIKDTDEYQNDVDEVRTLLINSLGNETVFPEDNPVVFTIVQLIATQRYFIRHTPELGDIDLTPFIDLLQAEIGAAIPLTSTVPVREFLRESKAWLGNKGTEKLYHFAGDVINSPIRIDHPYELIFETDGVRSCLDGAMSGHPLDFRESKLARLRDSVFWSNFTYIITVLQAQQVDSMSDLLSIIKSVHPAGTKYFLKVQEKYRASSHIPTTRSCEFVKEYYRVQHHYPTLDNNWFCDGIYAMLDQNRRRYWTTGTDIREYLPLIRASAYRRIQHDRYMHEYLPLSPWVAFSRSVAKSDDTYETKYTDNDELLYLNATTNMGLASYPMSLIENKTMRELQHVAWDNDGKNMDGLWNKDLLMSKHVETI